MKEWNLKEVYENDEAWNKDYDILNSKISEVSKFEGTLNTKEGLEKFFNFQEDFDKKLDVMYSYCHMSYDKNQKDLNYQALLNKVRQLLQNYVTELSFVDNELLKQDYEVYQQYAKESKIINEHLFDLKKLFDAREHVLSPECEKLLSNYSMVSSGYSRMYSMLQNSDFTPIEVTLSSNKKVLVSPNNYTTLLAQTDNQDDRRKIFEAQFGYYEKHKNTLTSIYKGIVDNNIATMKSKGYDSFLSVYLDGQKIPTSVYMSLINTVRNNTKPLKRFINLRKKYFNLEQYHTYDRFLTFSNSEVKYPYEKAYNDVLEALKPMGEDFVNHALKALADGHVDVYPTDGKRSGAYSTGIYGHGPYILLNHTDTLDSAFTLAHECGHSIHTLYSCENQPYATKDYRIFVAEIPSTFNEQLFLDYLLKNSDDKDLKIQALEQQIDGIVGTFYRQTLFANFEYLAHQLVIDGKPFTYESLCNIMKDLYNDYYGIDLDTEPLKKFVWAYIPHMFNTPFYVYQYATCFSASMKMFEDVKNNVKGAKEKYLRMLTLGGSMYPVDEVIIGGVDLTSPAPFEAVCNKLDNLLDELESLLQTK